MKVLDFDGYMLTMGELTSCCIAAMYKIIPDFPHDEQFFPDSSDDGTGS
jgi:hypothetical protein